TNVGVMWEKGIGTGAADLGQSAEWYKKACDAGLSDGCNYLTTLIQRMREECEPPKQQKPAAKPAKPECTNLGYVHEKGIGVEQDYRAAADYYKRACDLKKPVGCSNLGILYDQGRGVG